MTDKVRCETHGETVATLVCRHIAESLDTGKAVGFNWSEEDLSDHPDAWCSDCEELRFAEGDWTNAAMAFAAVKVICGACYDRAKQIWLDAREADTATRH